MKWLWAPGFGKRVWDVVERYLGAGCVVHLDVSIDPTEARASVIRRLNFYIALNFRVKAISHRQKFGPLLHMQKTL